MYRLLIADDEEIERKVIKMAISKSDIRLADIFEAQNGREAIEISYSKRPDIILMDIKMPGINGIDAIKEIKKKHGECYIIITTAYDYFNYAKEALELDVKDYLLKPIKKEMLLEKLREAEEYLDERNIQRRKELELKEQINTLKPILENELCFFIIYDDIKNIEYRSYLDILNIKFDMGYCMIINIKNKKDGMVINDFEKNFTKKKVHECVRDEAKNCGPNIVSNLLSSNITIFFSVEGNEDKYNIRLNAINNGRKLADTIKEKTGMSTVIGIGECYDSIELLKKSYTEAFITLKYETIPMRVRHYSDIKPVDMSQFYNSIEWEKLLSEKIAAGDLQESLYYFNEILDLFIKTYGHDITNVKNAILQLMLTIIIAAQNLGMHTDLKGIIKIDNSLYFGGIENIENIENIRFWGLQKITEIINKIKVRAHENEQGIVVKAKTYVLLHYCMHVTLEEVANHVCVSPYYLSKIFKKGVGENFTDYITKLRITKAKELLSYKDASVKEICYKVGYNDPNYFSRVFKKSEGFSPSEYKMIYAKQC